MAMSSAPASTPKRRRASSVSVKKSLARSSQGADLRAMPRSPAARTEHSNGDM
jgi:hypothetical protein